MHGRVWRRRLREAFVTAALVLWLAVALGLGLGWVGEWVGRLASGRVLR